MKTIKIKIDVTPKKGTTQTTIWGLSAAYDMPYPYERCNGSWRDTSGSITYYAALLRSDLTTEQDNRVDYAGYNGNPGTIVYRGVDLGELTLRIERDPVKGYANIGTGYNNGHTHSARAWMEGAIIAPIRQALATHAAELQYAAETHLRSRMMEQVTEMHQNANKLESAIETVIAKIKGEK